MIRTSSAGVSTPAAILSVAALAVAVAIAFAAAGNRAGTPEPSDVPSTPVVTPAPSAPASPAPTPEPSVPATPGPSQGVDGSEIPLDVFLGHDVVLGISDREGLVVDAVSGSAKDGMSVRWGTAIVRNIDADTIEVTWAGYPRDELVTLVVRPDADRILLRFGQEMPYPNTDAMGADRVVVLSFLAPVSAEDVVTDFTTVDD